MVALMMSPSRQQSTAMRDCDFENKIDAIVSEDKVGSTWTGDDLTKACTFWCAVAIGALAKGHPIESTASYLQLAKEALARYSGPTNFGLAKAWTILAYLHGFVGDMDGFYEYLTLADNFVRDSEQGGSLDSLPVGFSEVVKHGEMVKLFTGAAEEEEVESLLAQQVSFPKISAVAPEAHISRYVMQYQWATELTIQQAARTTGGTTQVGAHDAELTDDDAVKGSKHGDEMGGTCSPSSVPKCSETGNSDWDQIPSPVFRLEDAMERTSIRAGFGGLIINGILFFDHALKGDFKGALERIGCCVDILEEFPGLARFGMASTEALFSGQNVDLLPLQISEGIKTIRDESSDSIDTLKRRQASPTTPRALSTPSAMDTVSAASPPGCDGAMNTLSEDDIFQSEATASPCRVETVDGAESSPSSDEGAQREECFASSSAQAPEGSHSSLHPSNAVDEDAQDHVIAAEDWFDVINAMGAADTNNRT
ncbi:unnamed protein product [Ectocarpus sp. 12 AP-2014]